MSADATQSSTGSGPHPKNDMNGVCGSKTASMHADKCLNKDAVTSETNFIGSPLKTSPGLARKTVSPVPQRKLSPSGGKIKTYPAGSGSSHVNKSFHPFPQERFQSPIQHRMTEKESGDRHSPRKHDKGTNLRKSDKSPMDENLARSPSLSELNRLHSPTFGGLTFPSVTDPTLPIRPLLGSYFGLLPFLGQSHVPSPLDLYPSASALSLNGGGLSKLPPSLVSYLHQQSGVVPPRCSAPSSSCKDPCCVECFSHFQTPSVVDKLFGGSTTNSDALAQAAVSSLFLLSPAAAAARASGHLSTSPSSSLHALSSLYPGLFGHLQAANGPWPHAYVCPCAKPGGDYCGKRFASSEDLLVHLRGHWSADGVTSGPPLGFMSAYGGGLSSGLHPPWASYYPYDTSSSPRLQRSISPSSLLSVTSGGRYHPYSKSLSLSNNTVP